MEQDVNVPDKLLSVAELATYLGVSQMTIYLWHKEGRISAIRLGTRSLRFDVAAVLREFAESSITTNNKK